MMEMIILSVIHFPMTLRRQQQLSTKDPYLQNCAVQWNNLDLKIVEILRQSIINRHEHLGINPADHIEDETIDEDSKLRKKKYYKNKNLNPINPQRLHELE